MSKASDKADRVLSARGSIITNLNHATRDHRGRPILYFVHRRTAASGMSRVFSTFVVRADTGDVHGLDYAIAAADIGCVAVNDGYRVSGCGMDMRFHVADTIARTFGRSVAGIMDGNSIAIAWV